MGYGIVKIHHAVMKSTALKDYKVVKRYCEANGLPTTEPKGKHWHKTEDATAEMLTTIKDNSSLKLHRGAIYYESILPDSKEVIKEL